MQRWTRFGEAIGSRMAFIAPCCVAVGVLFPGTFSHLTPFVTAMFAAMTFQGSLNNTFRQVAGVFRHPLPMLGVLAVVLVAMPVMAWALASVLFGNDPNLVIGVLLEYSVPVGVVSFMWVGMYGGNAALGLATILVSTVLAPFSIPLTLQLLMGASVQVDVVGMMGDMLVMIALPAVAGMVVNDATHGWGRRTLSPVLSPACRVLLILIITTNSTAMADYMRHLTPELVAVAIFILLFAMTGYVWGFLLARLLHRPLPDLVTMCFDCGLRNISAGAVIAAAYFPGEVVFPVMMGTLFQQVIAAVFGQRMRSLVEAERVRTEAMVERGQAALGEVGSASDGSVPETGRGSSSSSDPR